MLILRGPGDVARAPPLTCSEPFLFHFPSSMLGAYITCKTACWGLPGPCCGVGTKGHPGKLPVPGVVRISSWPLPCQPPCAFPSPAEPPLRPHAQVPPSLCSPGLQRLRPAAPHSLSQNQGPILCGDSLVDLPAPASSNVIFPQRHTSAKGSLSLSLHNLL